MNISLNLFSFVFFFFGIFNLEKHYLLVNLLSLIMPILVGLEAKFINWNLMQNFTEY